LNNDNKKYTISLDIGTNSVGWAVLSDFELAKKNKKIKIIENGQVKIKKQRTNLWGARLFDEASTAEGRRLKRGQRRRIARRTKRLNYLRNIFEEHIAKFDPNFFHRLEESFLQNDDDNKLIKTDYPLFSGALGSMKDSAPFSLGETYTNEAVYYEKYPTIYHLRHRLMEYETQADLRLVYLACHHILKYRGHFVNQGQTFNMENINVSDSLKDLLTAYDKEDIIPGFDFKFEELQKYEEANTILTNRKFSKSKKAYELTELYSVLNIDENYSKYEKETKKKTEDFLKSKDAQLKALFTAIVGNSIDLAKIFSKQEYSNKENDEMPKGADFKYSLDAEKYEELLHKLEIYLTPEEIEVINLGKVVYESIVLCNILTEKTLSASMIAKYNSHKEQLKELKEYSKSIGKYKEIFGESCIYDEYIKKASKNPREEFYSKLKNIFFIDFEKIVKENNIVLYDKEHKEKKLSNSGVSANFNSEFLKLNENQFIEFQEKAKFLIDILSHMEFETYLPKQRYRDNGSIPYQIHEAELEKILKNSSIYYPFLGEKVSIELENEEGEKSFKQEYKIQTLMKFRIPYYVGPLTNANKGEQGKKQSDKSRFAWMQKNKDNEHTKITPWNFNEVVDRETSATEFIERMTSFCTYLPEEKVLPKNSLIYQEFTVYNELSTAGWQKSGGKRQKFQPDLRQKIVENLFKKIKKVTAKKMVEFLYSHNYTTEELSTKQLFGIDTVVKDAKYNTSYSTYIDLKNAGISEQMIEENKEKFEQIIKWATIFEDKKILKKTITNANEKWNLFDDIQIKNLSKLRYTGWGRVSNKLLTEIKAANGKTILENLKEDGYRNFMRLLEDEQITNKIRESQLKDKDVDGLSYSLVEDLAGSPAIKKGIWQSLKIVSELEQFLGRENIEKVVIEMARGTQGGRTTTRKKQIENFYSKSEEKLDELKEQLKAKEDKAFNNERLFLYFLQNAKCMYSNEPLYLSELSRYEVDHIIPQSYIKDDSFDNKVLVKREANQNKGGDVPSKAVINKMAIYWEVLAKNGQVSPKKLSNLKRGSLSENDKESFINRQLVETRQITKHVANILNEHFHGTNTEILTPKAGLTSQFRQGIIYIPKSDKEVIEKCVIYNGENYTSHEEEDKIYYNLEEALEKSIVLDKTYKNSHFHKIYWHKGFHKNRDINDHHHAHDAYLNAVVANYIYKTRPDLKNMWVYGEYQRKAEKETGKYAPQRDKFFKQLLSGMEKEIWQFKNIDFETGEVTEYSQSSKEIMNNIEKTLDFRNVNVVKKTEKQEGKFGDESVYGKDAKKIPVKSKLDPKKYGGQTAPISAFAVLRKDKKGTIIAESVSAMEASNYKKLDSEIVVSKYTKYKLSNGAVRLMASFQEAQNANQIKSFKIPNEKSSIEEFEQAYNILSDFIISNKLFTEKNEEALKTNIKEKFMNLSPEDEKDDKGKIKAKGKLSIIKELIGVTKGSNQGLNALKDNGLSSTAQRLKTGNIITNDTTLIYQSPTGLYETRRKLT